MMVQAKTIVDEVGHRIRDSSNKLAEGRDWLFPVFLKFSFADKAAVDLQDKL